MPIVGNNYATIKDFIDNAPAIQQQEFWRLVGNEIENELEAHDKLYVSTHGLGVPYLHVRLCPTPKYYHTINP